MNFYESVEYIHSLERFGINPGLERIELLCEKLGNPQKGMKFFHIAGTNGKGSTSTFISEILQSAGYNVGLYTSPYVIEFRERIQFNGEMIEYDELAFCVSTLREIIESEGIKATEFEVITAAALLYFRRKNCDYVVLEVGLGGRFDATNIIDSPVCTTIASISLDHTAILGDTIEKIAFEKCGIIKSGSKVVSYPLQDESALRVIRETCENKNVPLTIPDTASLTIKNVSLSGTYANYKDIDFLVRLPGKHMVYNCITAIETVLSALPEINKNCISEGIANTVMPARTELFSLEPVVLLDGGHNEGCAYALRDYITSYLGGRKIRMVSSIMADKDYDRYLSIVLPLADEFTATNAVVPRALPSNELALHAQKYCTNVKCIPDSGQAVIDALDSAEDDSAVVICGSFYLAGEIRNILKERYGND